MNEPATHSADLIPIGRFSHLSRLSLKALRLYDALGLLPPAYVDPTSSYRYYTRAQLRNARLIGLLRGLGMPLSRITHVLTLSGAGAAREVAAYWHEVEMEAAAKRKLVYYLGEWLEGRGEEMFEVETREVPEQQIVCIQRSVYVKDLPGLIDRSHRELYGALAQAGLKAGEQSFVIYHGEVNEDSDGPVEVCVPFLGSMEPIGEMRVRLEPAHREALTTITLEQCEFPGILKAYDAVYGWIEAQGLERTAAPREVYFASAAQIGLQDPFCDIAFPVR
jgi:DNA-binding transcriptional MerR regulator